MKGGRRAGANGMLGIQGGGWGMNRCLQGVGRVHMYMYVLHLSTLKFVAIHVRDGTCEARGNHVRRLGRESLPAGREG